MICYKQFILYSNFKEVANLFSYIYLHLKFSVHYMGPPSNILWNLNMNLNATLYCQSSF